MSHGRRRGDGTLGLALRLFLVCWMLWVFLAMALLGFGHASARWCAQYSVPTNPACRFVDRLLVETEGHK